MSGVAVSLGLAGDDWLSSKQGDAFGIDDVGVESGDTLVESSLELGKYLSPGLYISYAVGLFCCADYLHSRGITVSVPHEVNPESPVYISRQPRVLLTCAARLPARALLCYYF